MSAVAGFAAGTVSGFGFQNTYARLPERFFARLNPTPVAAPRLIELNVPLARTLGLDPAVLAGPEGVAVLAGNRVADGSEPLAIAYAGHQFGGFVPQLGDGRANLLGEIRGFDVQLKGSGPTPFSRRGDGRAALGPVLREYLVSEAMAALGVPTTRALAAVVTGERVAREEFVPGAVLTRVAASHLRVGTFQYFRAREDMDGIRTLADYAIARHYPAAAGAEQPYLALLEGVIARQARLVAQWMTLGFVHGVMNTDNTSISGETIDYGPCAYLEAYDEATVFSSIDRQGRYAYGNQPGIMLWNLTRLAECLLPLLGEKEAGLEEARAALGGFQVQYEVARQAGFARRIGLTERRDGDEALVEDLLAAMQEGHADFTLVFRRLAEPGAARKLFAEPVKFDSWEARWRARLASEPEGWLQRMREVNPVYLPRNHQVEAALRAAADREDFAPFRRLLAVVTAPFQEQPGMEAYETPALPEEQVTATFCGT